MAPKKGYHHSGQFKKGEAPGRPPGSKNKITKSVKEKVFLTFCEMQDIPGVNLLDWAKANPSLFYPLSAKLIPTGLDTKMTGVIKVIRE